MSAITVGFAIDPELRPALDEVVKRYGGGNRSAFLRLAVRDYQARLRLEGLHALRETARQERGGRLLTPDEVMQLVKQPV